MLPPSLCVWLRRRSSGEPTAVFVPLHLECYPGSIDGMKLSVSLTEEDVATLDRYAEEAGLPSRSAALRHAIGQLRTVSLEEDYAAAWGEWASSGDADEWESTVSDGDRHA